MKKSAKIVLGITTLWPIIYMCLFFIFMFSMFLWIPQQSSSGGPPVFITGLFGLHFFTMLLIFGLIAVYIVNIFRNDRIENDKKALWAVVIFLGNMFAMPVYWYLYIWKE